MMEFIWFLMPGVIGIGLGWLLRRPDRPDYELREQARIDEWIKQNPMSLEAMQNLTRALLAQEREKLAQINLKLK